MRTPFFPKLIQLATLPAYRSFLQDTKNPKAAQNRVWRDIVQELNSSPFWKKKFAGKNIPSLQDFPITSYEFYQEAIQRSKVTGISELSGSPVLYWALSSGTMGVNKFFPITELFRRQFQRTMSPFVHQLLHHHPGFLEHPVLYFVFAGEAGPRLAGKPVGYISAFNYHRLPALMKKQYAFPSPLLQSAELFAEWYPLYALRQDLSAMFAITPMAFTKLIETIIKHHEDYADYFTGHKKAPASLPSLKMKGARWQQLKKIFASGRFDFPSLWPSLKFLCSWKSSVCGFQLRSLQPFLGTIPVMDATYSATEGWMNVPLGGASMPQGGPLHPGAHVFEFLPADKADNTRLEDELLPCWELEIGKEYEVFLTTGMGFIRYRLGDVVKCTGMFHQTPVIEFVQKSGNDLSLGDVKIAEKIFIELAQQTGLVAAPSWVFAPNNTSTGIVLYHLPEWKIPVGVVEKIEQGLLHVHREYELVRAERLLQSVEAKIVPVTHPFWQARLSPHAQSKPSVLARRPPLDFENNERRI